MKTELDKCYEILLSQLFYDGKVLVAEVEEQFVGKNGNIETNFGKRKFNIKFNFPTSHILLEEFAESVANLVKSDEEGFLRKMENQSLIKHLGLDVPEKYKDLDCYALITSHEVLIVFCEINPTIELFS